jgi:hypothetical protein
VDAVRHIVGDQPTVKTAEGLGHQAKFRGEKEGGELKRRAAEVLAGCGAAGSKKGDRPLKGLVTI